MLLLNVPYAEKDEAKKLGASWIPEYKKWSVFLAKDYHKFDKWIPHEQGDVIICDYIFLIIGEKRCFKCGKTTKVVGVGIDKYITIEKNHSYVYHKEDIHISPIFENLPHTIYQYLNLNYKVKYGYSNYVQASYWGNYCHNCGALQGNFFVFNEFDSPFFIDSDDSEGKISKLQFYKIKLPFDVICKPEIIYSSSDRLLSLYGNFQEIQI